MKYKLLKDLPGFSKGEVIESISGSRGDLEIMGFVIDAIDHPNWFKLVSESDDEIEELDVENIKYRTDFSNYNTAIMVLALKLQEVINKLNQLSKE